MAAAIQALVLPIDPANPDQVGAFVGGLFVALIRLRFDRLLDTMSDKDVAAEMAFDAVVRDFPNPIHDELMAQRANFVAAARNKN